MDRLTSRDVRSPSCVLFLSVVKVREIEIWSGKSQGIFVTWRACEPRGDLLLGKRANHGRTYQDCVPFISLFPPKKFPENNIENNSLLFLNSNLLLPPPPISQAPMEDPSPSVAEASLSFQSPFLVMSCT